MPLTTRSTPTQQRPGHHAVATTVPNAAVPSLDIGTLRHIRRLQRRFEIGFCAPGREDQPPRVEVLTGTRDYHRLAQWFLRRKPFFDPEVLNTYHRLLRQHMGHKTITAFLSVDPEDGWISMEFSVYGCRPLRKGQYIHPMHAQFLAAVYHEGLQYRQMDDHIGLRLLDHHYRPALAVSGGRDVPVPPQTVRPPRRKAGRATR